MNKKLALMIALSAAFARAFFRCRPYRLQRPKIGMPIVGNEEGHDGTTPRAYLNHLRV
ncbi:MAG: hypothetical protein GX123_00450 [Clostridiales bacterium]|nr:hypothetical protein [Clostridiales bacterium]